MSFWTTFWMAKWQDASCHNRLHLATCMLQDPEAHFAGQTYKMFPISCACSWSIRHFRDAQVGSTKERNPGIHYIFFDSIVPFLGPLIGHRLRSVACILLVADVICLLAAASTADYCMSIIALFGQLVHWVTYWALASSSVVTTLPAIPLVTKHYMHRITCLIRYIIHWSMYSARGIAILPTHYNSYYGFGYFVTKLSSQAKK